jgi:hypothetical protein
MIGASSWARSRKHIRVDYDGVSGLKPLYFAGEGLCDDTKCTSLGGDCYAPGNEAKTCASGYHAKEYGEGRYTCCPPEGMKWDCVHALDAKNPGTYLSRQSWVRPDMAHAQCTLTPRPIAEEPLRAAEQGRAEMSARCNIDDRSLLTAWSPCRVPSHLLGALRGARWRLAGAGCRELHCGPIDRQGHPHQRGERPHPQRCC